MRNITNFDFEGHNITFEFADGNNMINANQMAKPFGKRIDNFLRLKETKQYIALLEYEINSDTSHVREREAIRVVKGGKPELQGTWMDEKLALKFAAWLSPRFEIWVYDRIHELLTTGKTELTTSPAQSVIKSLRLIADQLEAHEKGIYGLKEDFGEIKERVNELEAKIISVDDNYYTIAGFCSLTKKPCPLHLAKNWGKQATALSRQRAVPTGTAHDERFGKVRTYHIDILKAVIK
ncbi:MAG TPA: KilA-N domain-containing protein [Bacteroidetes bacterium]|nr:KilA-N domain-containing protein [Bacteroidota bacterium]